MAEAPFTDPNFFATPTLQFRGVPDSIQIHATRNDTNKFLGDPLVAEAPGARLPNNAEELSRWRKFGRFITTPLSLAAAQFSPRTAPSAWDIITQKKEFSFSDVLLDKGVDESKARWWGLALDIVLDPLNFISFFGLTKLGKLARATSGGPKLGKILAKEFTAVKGLDDAVAAKGFKTMIESLDLKKASPLAQRSVVAQAANANLEFGTTWWEQISRAQRSFMTLNIPFRSVGGLSIVPKELSLMVFAIPRGARAVFAGTVGRIPIPGTGRTLAQAGVAAIRRGSGHPTAVKIDKLAQNALKGRIARATSNILKDIGPEARKLDLTELEEIFSAFEKRSGFDLVKSSMTTSALRKAGVSAKLASKPGVQKILLKMKEAMKNTLSAEQAIGLKVSQLDDDINYLLHYLTPEARAALNRTELLSLAPREWTTNHISMIRRLFRGKTIKQVNEQARKSGKAGLSILEGKAIKGAFFDVNPLTILTVRMHRSARSITGAQYLRSMAVAFGKEIPSNLKGKARKTFIDRLKRDGFTLRSSSDFIHKDFLFRDSAVLGEMDRHFAKFSQVESVGDFARFYDSILNFWKGMTLSLIPQYHTRNFIDNAWRVFLAGISPISIKYARVGLKHFDSVADLRNAQSKFITTARGERLTINELVNEAQNFSVIGHNARDAEFMVNQTDEAIKALSEGKRGMRGLVNPLTLLNKSFGKGFDFGRNFIENPFRLALYMDRRIKGESAIDAMLSVKKYLFDYEDLTDFERVIMRRIFPFYSFTRFNIPFQLEQLLNKPAKMGKIAIIAKSKVIPELAKKLLPSTFDNKFGEPSAKFLGEWQREGAPFFLGRDPDDPDTIRYFMLDGWNSSVDLLSLFDPKKMFFRNLSPLLKTPLEQMINWQFFWDRPLVAQSNFSDSLKETENFLGMTLSRRLVHVLRNVRAFNEFDKILKNFSNPNTKISTAVLRSTIRTFVGGSFAKISEEKGARDLKFRLRKISQEGRKAYLRELRKGNMKNANEIMQRTLARLMRGF